MIIYRSSFVNTNLQDFPNTLGRNVSAPGSGDGTEFVKALVDDIWGRAYALLDYAGMSPNGVNEAPGTAQILDAISRGFGVGPGCGVMYFKNDTPSAKGDRVLLLQGQVVPVSGQYAKLVAATYCGDANNATAPAFYKTSDAGGTTRSTSGAYFVLPDTRGLVPRNIGTGVINSRNKVGPTALGEKQEDSFQGHEHNIPYNAGATGSGTGGGGKFLQGVGNIPTVGIVTNGTNGTPRVDAETRCSSFGTNFGIAY